MSSRSGAASVDPQRPLDVVVVGGGQAGLAVGYHLRRAGFVGLSDVVVLDANDRPGGAWQHLWPSMRLFSPPAYSSLPGWMMPSADTDYPPASHVVDYLERYEHRYDLPVLHGQRVTAVTCGDDDPAGLLLVTTTPPASGGVGATWRARAVVSATGTWGRPFVPHYPGAGSFTGEQLHSSDYRGPEPYAGRRVVVVGGGNTAAQLLAEVSLVAETTWVTLRPPRFLPDDVDGRVLFDVATARRLALDAGEPDTGGVAGLGDVVMVESVRDARDRGVLQAEAMFERLTPTGIEWGDGARQDADVILWCTGFRPDLPHLAPLGLRRDGTHPATIGTRAADEPRLHLVGYGDWTGPASATLIGVGRTARQAVREIAAGLAKPGINAR
ncbi:putative flavoprotein involved in K+ transport [Humibacillus xanthopallidus]|uniref:Putative flavoprotein involved in K+ transport n=1 Tax=Humibacillus xanthopallidus TaxID=412689 RepID=A0A543PKD9_9MICO|nr:ArsO family NAD(P)H-dependent flavin-containing monooxygenase [Humibacillus xanthopallidus]TQN44533.1 putative flavoprotein involved in K+ transport [Humibacillus xanthopallidus]